jgi:hypothetical protein
MYSLLAFDGYETRPGKGLIVLAVIGTVLVIVGSIWMAAGEVLPEPLYASPD